jgi:hypothetical protein
VNHRWNFLFIAGQGETPSARITPVSAGETSSRRCTWRRLAGLYRQQVLKEQPTIQIQGLGGKKKSPQQVLHKATE